MTNRDNRAAIAELAASEDGVFTSAQAMRLGIPRYALSQASKSGYIERLGQGAYRLASRMDDGLDELRALYKLTSPSSLTQERMGQGFDGVAAAGSTAAYILGVGDLYPSPWELVTPKRFNTRRDGVKFKVGNLGAEDVLWEDGVPVTRPELTIDYLLRDGFDMSIVGDAFEDAIRKYGPTLLDIDKLEGLLGERLYHNLCLSAGIGGKGSRRLVRLDSKGHVALIEVG